MPTYEYKCTSCEYKFEELQSFSAEPITVCPECKGKTERLITGGAGFVFKGSGFYVTENRSKDYKSAAEKDKPIPATPEKTDSKPKDSKPKTESPKKSDT